MTHRLRCKTKENRRGQAIKGTTLGVPRERGAEVPERAEDLLPGEVKGQGRTGVILGGIKGSEAVATGTVRPLHRSLEGGQRFQTERRGS